MLNTTRWKGHVAMLGANTLWGLMSPLAKLIMATGVISPFLLTGFRFWGAAALFWLSSLVTRREHVPPKDLLLLAGAGMIGVMLNQGCFIMGVGYTSPGEASVITTTMPMWVMLLAALILKEPITWKKGGGILLGATGAIILITNSHSALAPKGDNAALGDLLVLTAQLSYALYLTLYKNFIKKYSLVTLMKWMFTFAAIASLPVVGTQAADTDWSAVTPTMWWGIVYVAVAATFVAYICIMIGQKNLRPTVVGMYNYVQPVVAMLVGITLGLDSFTPMKSLAIALIFSGVYLVTISKSRADMTAEAKS